MFYSGGWAAFAQGSMGKRHPILKIFCETETITTEITPPPEPIVIVRKEGVELADEIDSLWENEEKTPPPPAPKRYPVRQRFPEGGGIEIEVRKKLKK